MFTKAMILPMAIGFVAGVALAAPVRRLLGMASTSEPLPGMMTGSTRPAAPAN